MARSETAPATVGPLLDSPLALHQHHHIHSQKESLLDMVLVCQDRPARECEPFIATLTLDRPLTTKAPTTTKLRKPNFVQQLVLTAEGQQTIMGNLESLLE
jgi:hypothetical protein